MRVSKLSPIEIVFVVLIILTVAMSIRDRLPASRQQIAEIQVLARQDDKAAQAVATTLAANRDMNAGEARRLRERVVSIELATSRLSARPEIRELANERDRLAMIPFWQMTFGDELRWLLISAGRYSTLIVGAFVGACAFLVLRGNGRLSRFRLR